MYKRFSSLPRFYFAVFLLLLTFLCSALSDCYRLPLHVSVDHCYTTEISTKELLLFQCYLLLFVITPLIRHLVITATLFWPEQKAQSVFSLIKEQEVRFVDVDGLMNRVRLYKKHLFQTTSTDHKCLVPIFC